MKSLDEKLAMLTAITGRNPLDFYEYHSHTSVSVDCSKVNCFDGCPFYNLEKADLCSAPKSSSPELYATPIRTYKDATTIYPELFL